MQTRRLSVAMADRQVDVLAREIHVMQRGAHPQIDVGMRFREAAQAMHEPFGGEVGGCADGQRPGVLALQQPLGAAGDAVECVAHDAQVRAPSFGDDEALALPIEELEAKLRFERLDLVADRALRHAQLLGGAREALMARGGLESLEGVQRWQAARHGSTS